MKTIITILMLMSISLITHADDTPLIPDSINKILGQLKPDMPEYQIEIIVKKHYENAKPTPSLWSGQTGYVEFKLNDRYSISIAEYNDPKDFNLKFVHSSMTFYVYDHELKRRINLSVYKWDDEKIKIPNQGMDPTESGS